MLCVAFEQAQDVCHTELADRFAAFEGCVGEFAFLFLKSKDAFFDGVGDGQAVDCYVLCLIQTMDAIDGLLFDELCKVSFCSHM